MGSADGRDGEEEKPSISLDQITIECVQRMQRYFIQTTSRMYSFNIFNFFSKVTKAVAALRQVVQSQNKEVRPFESNAQPINIQYNVIKTVTEKTNVRVQLKHHWLNDNASVCVFVRDVGDSIDYRDLHRDRDTGPSHEYYRALFETNNIKPTPKIYTMSEIKTEFTTVDLSAQLAKSHDRFLCDKRICSGVRKCLKNHFYRNNTRKLPMMIDVNEKNFKKEYNNALKRMSYVISDRGPDNFMTIGDLSLTDKQIVDNIEVAMKGVCEVMPGGLGNIRSAHINSTGTLSIPMHVSWANPNKVSSKVKQEPIRLDEPDDTGLLEEKIRILQNGDIQYIAEGDTGFEKKYVDAATALVNAKDDGVRHIYVNPVMKSQRNVAHRELGSRSRKREREEAMAAQKHKADPNKVHVEEITGEDGDAVAVAKPMEEGGANENAASVKKLNVKLPKGERKKKEKYLKGRPIEKKSGKNFMNKKKSAKTHKKKGLRK